MRSSPESSNAIPPLARVHGFSRGALIAMLAALLLLGSVMLLANKNRALSLELERLRQETAEVQALREEQKETQRLRNQVGELDRLRRENEEIHRLRNEARQLRSDKEELAKVSAENQQLRASVQQLQKAEVENRQLRGQTQQLQQLQTAMAANQHANACIANLKQLDGASQQWALENRKRSADPVILHEAVQYLRNAAPPVCPSGGTYSVSTVQGVPRCTIPGHTL